VLDDDSVIVVTRERLEEGGVGRVVFEGVYRIVGKKITVKGRREKPKVTMDREAIAEELDEVIIEAEGAIVEVRKAKLKVKPKSKDGQDTVKLNFLVKWTATLEDGSFIKIRQKYKGIGNPVFD
jgi:hypothetical protein